MNADYFRKDPTVKFDSCDNFGNNLRHGKLLFKSTTLEHGMGLRKTSNKRENLVCNLFINRIHFRRRKIKQEFSSAAEPNSEIELISSGTPENTTLSQYL